MVTRNRENGTTTIPDWQLAAIGGVLALVIGAVGTLVGWQIRDVQAKVSEHDNRITSQETVSATHTQQLRQIEQNGDRTYAELLRMNEKIDRVFDELRKK